MEADIQVVMVGRFAEKFDAWLRTMNLELVRLPASLLGQEEGDDLPTYFIGIGQRVATTPTGERV